LAAASRSKAAFFEDGERKKFSGGGDRGVNGTFSLAFFSLRNEENTRCGVFFADQGVSVDDPLPVVPFLGGDKRRADSSPTPKSFLGAIFIRPSEP
jgi:hypothetical protein